ncbi:hypothetical protein MRY82_00335 [bacterium]|nr:hypothetical protein [bacterium]
MKKSLCIMLFIASYSFGQNICEFLPSNEVRIYTDFNETNDLIDYLNSQKGKPIKDEMIRIYSEYRKIAYQTGNLHHCDTTSQKLNSALRKHSQLKSNLLFYHPNGQVDNTQIFHAVVIVKFNNRSFIIDITHDQFFCSNEGILVAEEKNYTPRINELGYARRSEIINRAPRGQYSNIKY